MNYPFERGLLVVRAAAGQADPRLHQFIGGHPATLEELRARYTTLTAGSPRLEEVWRNWIVRRRADSRPVGTVQATLIRHHEGWTAQVAWIIGLPWQHQGYASEAARALVGWLDSRHVHDLVAHIHPDHLASAKVAMRAGFPAHPRPGRRRAGLASTDEPAEVALQEELMRPEPLYRIPFTYPERWAVGLDGDWQQRTAPLDRGGRPSSSRSRRPSARWSG